MRTCEQADALVGAIRKLLLNGGTVDICTALKTTRYNKSMYADWFSFDAKGDIYVRSGSKKVCISFCKIVGYE